MTGSWRIDAPDREPQWFGLDQRAAEGEHARLVDTGVKQAVMWFDCWPYEEPLPIAAPDGRAWVREALQRRFAWLRLREEGA